MNLNRMYFVNWLNIFIPDKLYFKQEHFLVRIKQFFPYLKYFFPIQLSTLLILSSFLSFSLIYVLLLFPTNSLIP